MHVKVTDHLHDPPALIDLDVEQIQSVNTDLEAWPPFIVTGLDDLYMAMLGPEDAQKVMYAMVDLAIERRGQSGEDTNGSDQSTT